MTRRRETPMTHTSRRGQAVLELALVLPIFLVVFFAIIDFGRAFHIWFSLKHQCIEAAQVAGKRKNLQAAVNFYGTTTHADQQAVLAAFWSGMSPIMSRDQISGPILEGVGIATPTVTISAGYRFSPITPFFGALIGNGQSPEDRGTTFSAGASMWKE